MAELSTMPQEVNIEHYGGDTLTIHIKIDAAQIAGRVFTAQVRSKATSAKVDATFTVTTTAVGADIVLSSADVKKLSSRGVYEGVWDVQLGMPTEPRDPVTTLGYGTMLINPDVTRAAT